MTRTYSYLSALLLATAVTACSTLPEPATPTAFSNAVPSPEVMSKWSRSCALCHITGEAGAPVVGDTDDWQRRLAKGERQLIQNILYGINSMPPLGYCMSCEVSDFRAMVAYMAGANP